jgi:hypothetical protein
MLRAARFCQHPSFTQVEDHFGRGLRPAGRCSVESPFSSLTAYLSIACTQISRAGFAANLEMGVAEAPGLLAENSEDL